MNKPTWWCVHGESWIPFCLLSATSFPAVNIMFLRTSSLGTSSVSKLNEGDEWVNASWDSSLNGQVGEKAEKTRVYPFGLSSFLSNFRFGKSHWSGRMRRQLDLLHALTNVGLFLVATWLSQACKSMLGVRLVKGLLMLFIYISISSAKSRLAEMVLKHFC